MRAIYPFNQNWLYLNQQVEALTPDTDFVPVTIPHSNVILPYHNFDDQAYQFVSTYRKHFTLPEHKQGRRVFLDFEGVMIATTVTLNGHTYSEHRGGYTPFSLDITDAVRDEEDNLIVVHVDSAERKDIPPFGFVVDYLSFGGIYREVSLRYVDPIHLENVRVRTIDVLNTQPHIVTELMIQSDQITELTAHLVLKDSNQNTINEQRMTLNLSSEKSHHTIASEPLSGVERWTLDKPTRYTLHVSLLQGDRVVDTTDAVFGFRTAEFRADGFYLNGDLLPLRGLNRHQLYPYIGAAAPARLQSLDADIVKYELGCNIVRTSHYPQSRHFLDRCDEIGLLVFEEIPGWQHIGDEDWQNLSLRDVRVMIERDWNRPSIVLWGVRINESFDKDEFYTKTNQLARELDPTRQTAGVRFFEGSTFLEDVYTFNDFSNDVVEPSESPWLITEFNGHMFPTKTFDNEERRVEHAVRHARIQSKAVMMGGVSGAIGWCAFDYNTHLDFGSGDRICYHGVMDIFRQPKFAAFAYGSQIDPSQRILLEPATNWTMGDRNAGGNNPLMIFSNCERIEVYIGEESLGEFLPDHETYPGLPHPPTMVTGIGHRWGGGFQSLRAVGYIGDEPIAERFIAADSLPHHIDLKISHQELFADANDMAWVWFRIVDEYDNTLPYAFASIHLTLEGDGELVGDNPFPLVGGQAAIFVRAGHTAGMLKIRASAPRLPDAEITITLKQKESFNG